MTTRRFGWMLALAAATAAAGCNHPQKCGSGGSCSPQQALSAPSVEWRDSRTYAYHLDLSSRALVSGSPVPVAFALTGTLTLRTRRSADSTAFVATLGDSQLRITENPSAPVPPNLSGELAGPWGFDLVGGRARSMRLRGGSSAFASSIMSTLAAAFQTPAGQGEKGSPWTHVEADGSGAYKAEYRLGTEPNTLTKRKLSYEKTSLPAGTSVIGSFEWTPAVVRSNGQLRFRNGDLEQVRTHDELDVELTLKSKVNSTTDLALDLIQPGKPAAGPDWQELWASTSAVPMGQAVISNGPQRAHDSFDAVGVTFETALAGLEKAQAKRNAKAKTAATPSDDSAALGSFGKMVALLRSRPENVKLAAAAIRGRSSARMTLIDALGSAGGDAEQAALTLAMRDQSLGIELRRESAFALVRTSWPSEPSLDALISSLSDPVLKDYAIYGLGTYARRFREAGKPAVAARAVDRLISELEACTGDGARVEALRGIANAGDARAFGHVRRFLDDPDDSIRAAAVDSIRLMPNPEVDDLLAKHLAPTEKNEVRLAALDAAALREARDGLVRAVGTAATEAPDSRSRVHAVRLLGKWLTERAEIRPVLERVAQADSIDAVRRAAVAALGT